MNRGRHFHRRVGGLPFRTKLLSMEKMSLDFNLLADLPIDQAKREINSLKLLWHVYLCYVSAYPCTCLLTD